MVYKIQYAVIREDTSDILTDRVEQVNEILQKNNIHQENVINIQLTNMSDVYIHYWRMVEVDICCDTCTSPVIGEEESCKTCMYGIGQSVVSKWCPRAGIYDR